MQIKVYDVGSLDALYQIRSNFLPRLGDILRYDKKDAMHRMRVTDVVIDSNFKKATVFVEELKLVPKRKNRKLKKKIRKSNA